MEKNQNILKVLSYFVIIWNSVFLVLKILALTFLLVMTFLCANSIDLSTEVANTINSYITENTTKFNNNNSFSENSDNENGFKPTPGDSDSYHREFKFSSDGVFHFNINNNVIVHPFTVEEIQTACIVVAVVTIAYIVWTIFVKFLVILDGILGLRASKNPEKAKFPFILGCVISVFSVIKILCYIFVSGMGFIVTIGSIVFVVFTVMLGFVHSECEKKLKTNKAESEVIDNVQENSTENENSENKETE